MSDVLTDYYIYIMLYMGYPLYRPVVQRRAGVARSRPGHTVGCPLFRACLPGQINDTQAC